MNNEINSEINKITQKYGLTYDEILGGSRTFKIALVRGLLCYILRLHGLVYTEIGERLGNLHYSTVIYHTQKLSALVDANYHPTNLTERDVINTAREYRAKYNEAYRPSALRSGRILKTNLSI